MIRAAGTYAFDVVGDGAETQVLIPLRGLRAPAPFIEEAIPTGFGSVDVGGLLNAATIVLEEGGEFARLTFNNPPPADQTTKVTITALFGTKRI